MKQRHPQARQKMSRIIDEIGAALFACGATEVSLRLKKRTGRTAPSGSE